MENKKVFIIIDKRKFGRGVQLDIAEIDTYTSDKKGLKSFSANNNMLLTQDYRNSLFVKPDEHSLFFINERDKDYRAYEKHEDALKFIKLLLDSSIENATRNIKAYKEQLEILNNTQNNFNNFEKILAEYENLDEELFFNFNKNISKI